MMESFFEIAAVILSLYTIVAICLLMSYVFFKKPRLKIALTHFLTVCVLLAVMIGSYVVIGERRNAAEAAQKQAERDARPTANLTADMTHALSAQQPSDADPVVVAAIADLASQRLSAKNKEQYLPAIKAYFIYYHANLAPKKQPEIILGTEFDSQRRTLELR